MNIKFVDEASFEFLDAISYYEEEQYGLGRRFKAEVERTILWLVEHPEVYPLRPNAYRRLNLRIYPVLRCLHRSRTDVVDPCCRSFPP